MNGKSWIWKDTDEGHGLFYGTILPCGCRYWEIPRKTSGGEWSASCPGRPIPREIASGTDLMQGWVGPRACLHFLRTGKFLAPARIWAPDRPGRSLVTRILFLETVYEFNILRKTTVETRQKCYDLLTFPNVIYSFLPKKFSLRQEFCELLSIFGQKCT
jgi:hypothetical protein